MGDWYESLTGIEQVLFLTGVFSTLIFLLQLVLTFFGLGDDDADMDGDVGSDGGFALGDVFTLRNGVSFLMGFSWGGLMAFSWGIEYTAVIAMIGIFIGMIFVGVNVLLLVGMAQLRHDGSIDLTNAIDTEATVTLPIPARREGVGKVMVPIQGRLKEYHAITDGDALARNATVVVLDVQGSQLIVESES